MQGKMSTASRRVVKKTERARGKWSPEESYLD
jgi:hypothetical protein